MARTGDPVLLIMDCMHTGTAEIVARLFQVEV
jgi:hypothetical protein